MSYLFNKDNYIPRITDKMIREYLENFGAICVEGPKWCGKTWSSAYHSKSFFYVGDPNNNFSNRQLAIEKPSIVLKGEKPRLIDEWQEANGLWDATRAEVDKLNIKGAFILTGSSTPKNKGVLHSGTGRIASLKMSTMTLYETGDSTSEVSLEKLCNGFVEEKIVNETSIEKLAELIVRGGWPGNIKNSNPTLIPKSYIDNIISNDLIDENQKLNHKTLELILKSLARNESTTASNLTIVKDIQINEDKSISKDTVAKYLDILDRLFLISNQSPFSPNVRSPLRIKQQEKRHLCDPSLACALLNLNTKKLLNDLNTMGFLFESLVEHDLKVYAQSFDAKLCHYQNYDGDKIDSIIEMPNGEWCAFEIKLGVSKIEEASNNLNRVCNKMVKAGLKEPKIKCVISGLSNTIYKKDNGVYVIPFTCLKN